MWRGTVTLRKTHVRVEGILRERASATVRAIAPNETRWSDVEYLIAHAIDTYVAMHSDDPNTAPRVPRPGEKEAALTRLEARKKRFDERQARAIAAAEQRRAEEAL